MTLCEQKEPNRPIWRSISQTAQMAHATEHFTNTIATKQKEEVLNRKSTQSLNKKVYSVLIVQN